MKKRLASRSGLSFHFAQTKGNNLRRWWEAWFGNADRFASISTVQIECPFQIVSKWLFLPRSGSRDRSWPGDQGPCVRRLSRLPSSPAGRSKRIRRCSTPARPATSRISLACPNSPPDNTMRGKMSCFEVTHSIGLRQCRKGASVGPQSCYVRHSLISQMSNEVLLPVAQADCGKIMTTLSARESQPDQGNCASVAAMVGCTVFSP